MAKYTNQVEYQISTYYDNSGLNKLMTQLNQVENEFVKLRTSGSRFYTEQNYQADMANLQKFKHIMSQSINAVTGKFSISQFNDALSKSGTTLASLQKSFNNAGTAGQIAMNNLLGNMTKMNTQMKQTSEMSEKIMNTLGNTVRWGIIAAGFQSVMSSIQKAASYVGKLDESLTQITMVSGESRDNMKEFAQYANKAAAALGSATTDYTNAVKVFIQEGFTLEESKRQAEQATILGNVSEQDTATTADQITAYRNAFQLSIEEMDSSLDKLANIANKTAANVSELMTAAQKSASTAASVGASEDSFLASIATIQSVTRESAENIGNGLKSIYTRFADVKTGGESSEGGDSITYGQYSQALKAVGVDIIKNDGTVKTMDEILAELQKVWQTLDRSQKLAVGEKVAGRYQYNRFATLMENQEYYDKAYAATQNASGSMAQMQEDYMQGIEAMTQTISTNIESIFTSLYKSGSLEGIIKVFAQLSDILSNIVNTLDTGLPLLDSFSVFLTGIVALVGKLGPRIIASGITNFAMNRANDKKLQQDNKIRYEQSKNGLAGMGLDISSINSYTKQMIQQNMELEQYRSTMTKQQLEDTVAMQEKQIQIVNKLISVSREYKSTINGMVTMDRIFATSISELSNELSLNTEQIQINETNITKWEQDIATANNIINSGTASSQKIAGQKRVIKNRQNKIDDAKEQNKQFQTQRDRQTANLAAFQRAAATLGGIDEDNLKNLNIKDIIKSLNLEGWAEAQGNLKNTVSSINSFTESIYKAGIKTKTTTEYEKKLQEESKKLNDIIHSDIATLKQKEEAIQQLDVVTKKLQNAEEAQVDLDNKAFISAKKLAESYGELAKSSALTTEQSKNLLGAQKGILNIWSKVVSGSLSVERALKSIAKIEQKMRPITSDLATAYDDILIALNNMGPKGQKIVQILENLSIQFENNKAQLAAFSKEVYAFQQRIHNIGTAIGNFASYLMAGEMAVSGLLDITNTLQDTEISQEEKIKQIASSVITLTMSIAMLWPLIESKLVPAVTSLGGKLLTLVNAKKATSLAAKGMAAAEIETAIATNALSLALKQFLIPILVITAAIAAFSAIIGVMIWNTGRFDRAVEEAQENLESANKSVENAAQALSDLNDSLNNIKDNDSAFEELTQGTAEFTEALNVANQEVLSLLKKYPELANYITTGVYGQLTIDTDSDAVQEIIAKYQKNYSKALAGESVTQQDVDQATNNQVVSQFTEKKGLTSSGSTVMVDQTGSVYSTDSYWVGTKYEGDEESQLKIIGEIAQAISNNSKYNGSNIAENESALEAYIKNKIPEASEQLINALTKNTSELAEVGKALNINSNQQKNNQLSYAKSILSSQQNEAYSKSSSQIQNAVASRLTEDLQEDSKAYQESKEEATKNGYLTTTGWDAIANGGITEAGKKAYAEQNNYVYQDGKFYEKNENGKADTNSEITGITSEVIKEGLIGSGIVEKFDTETVVKEIYNGYNNLNKNNVSTNNVGAEYVYQLSQGNIDNSGLLSYLNEDGQINTSNIDDDTAIEFGFENAEGMKDAIEEAVASSPYLELDSDGKLAIKASVIFDEATFTEGIKDNSLLYNKDHEVTTDLGAKLFTVLDESRYTEAQQYELFKLIDENTSEDEIKSLINQILEGKEYSEAKSSLTSSSRAQSAATASGLDYSETKSLAEDIQATAESSDELSDSLKNNKKAALDVAVAQQQLNKGVSNLNENFDDWNDAIEISTKDGKKFIKATTESAAAVKKMKSALNDTLGITDELAAAGLELSDQFIADNMEDIALAAEGDADAIDRLKFAAATDIVQTIAVDNNLKEETINEILNKQADLQSQIGTVEVGATLNDDDFLNECTEMITAAKMTASEAQAYLASMGIDAEIEEGTTPITEQYWQPATYITEDDGTGTGHKKLSLKEEGKFVTVEGMAQATGLKVTSATKTSGGNIGLSKSSISNSSSGGSSKTLTAKTKEYDRYEKVNNQLDKNTSQYDKLSQAQDRLSGNSLTENLLEQNQLLEEQIALQQEKQLLREQEQTELKEELTGYGITFDKDGIISNWKDIIEQMNAEGEALAASGDEDALDEWEERFDDIQEAYDRWNELDDEIIENQTEMIEKTNQITENIFKGYTTIIDFADTLDDMNDSLNEFEQTWARINGKNLTIIEYDQAKETAADMLNSKSVKAKNYRNTISTAIKTAEDEETKSFYQQFQHGKNENYLGMITQDQKVVQEIYDTLLAGGTYKLQDGVELNKNNIDVVKEFLETVTEGANEAAETMINVIDTAKARIDEILESHADSVEEVNHQLERNIENIDYLISMSEDLYGDNAAKVQQELYQELAENTKLQIRTAKDQLAAATSTKKSFEKIRNQYEEGSEEYEYWNEKVNEAKEEEEEITDRLNDALKTLVQTARDLAASTSDNAVNDIMSQIFGANENGDSSLYYLSKQWEILNDQVDEYYDGVNRSYQISSLKNKYLDLLDNTSDVSIQKQITAQMNEQLEILNEKEKISKYDMEYQNALLDVMEKQIALQDAQNNKSKVKLKRDSQGNYTYQYVSDDDAIRSAQQELADSTNNLYNLVNDRYAELKEMSYNLSSQLKSDLRDVLNDATLSETEQEALCKQLIDKYYNDMSDIGATAGETYDQLLNAAKQSLNNFDISNSELFTKLDERVQAYLTEDGTDSWLDKITNFAESTAGYFGEDGTLVTTISKAITTLHETISTVVGSKNSTKNTTINGQINNIKSNTNKAKEAVDSLKETLADETWLKTVKTIWGKVTKTITSAQTAATEIATTTDTTTSEKTKKTTTDKTKTSTDTANYDASDFNTLPEPVILTSDALVATNSYATGNKSTPYRGKKVWIQEAFEGRTSPYLATPSQKWDGTNADTIGWFNIKQFVGYDTGGYTGNWSDTTFDDKNGKLAVLHQKELVLNAEQTQHILEAAQLVSSMTNGLQNLSFDNLFSSLSSLVTLGGAESPIEQNITINADFPAAESAAEIKLALESLSDQAMQYAYRTK